MLSSYLYSFTPFYTNILYDILPFEVWTIIGIGQYIFPVLVLAKINASRKSWFYMLLYPVFVYSWIPITLIGFWHRNDHEWSHTQHTRSMSYRDVLVTETTQPTTTRNMAFTKESAK